MTLQKKDFIEIEFTGMTKDGEIFDSNIKEDLEKLNSDKEPKPFIFALGQDMFLKGVDEFLIGKPEPSEPVEYEVELSPEKAFGSRNPKLIQRMPMTVFREQNLKPVPGIMFNFDGRIGKVLAVSGGRVMVDFNNPIAGKDVIYKIKVLRKVEDINEQIKAFTNFLFRKDLDFEVDKENKKIILKTDPSMAQFAGMFKDKFKEIFDMELEVKEQNEQEDKSDKKKSKPKEESQ